MSIDEAKLNVFMEKMVNDVGTAMSAVLVLIGDKLGLYRALAEGGPMTSVEFAKRTGNAERYLREWLAAQAASGYTQYDPATKRYSMTPEQAMVFAEEGSPVFLGGAFEVIGAVFRDEPKVTDAFRTGRGVGWHEHDAALFHGTERLFRPGYAAHLVEEWLPALDGVVEKLRRGGKVADVGCGWGTSTIIMAKAFPQSTFIGFDSHPPSIEKANAAARAAGLSADKVRFEVASAKNFPGKDYDLIAYFDCLHDMGDPVGAAKYAQQALKSDGTCMAVEPFANDTVQENLTPIGRLFYAGSTMVCTGASLSQEVGLALGAQAGEARLRDVMTEAGFSRFRRATETPFNLVLEARP